MVVKYFIDIKANHNGWFGFSCSKTNWPRFLSHYSTPNTCFPRYFGTCSTGKWRCRTACRHCLEEIRLAPRSWHSASRSTEVLTCRTCWNLWYGRSSMRRHRIWRWILPGTTTTIGVRLFRGVSRLVGASVRDEQMRSQVKWPTGDVENWIWSAPKKEKGLVAPQKIFKFYLKTVLTIL